MPPRVPKQLSMTEEILQMLAKLAEADQTSHSGKVRQLILAEYRRRYEGQSQLRPMNETT